MESAVNFGLGLGLTFGFGVVGGDSGERSSEGRSLVGILMGRQRGSTTGRWA